MLGCCLTAYLYPAGCCRPACLSQRPGRAAYYPRPYRGISLGVCARHLPPGQIRGKKGFLSGHAAGHVLLSSDLFSRERCSFLTSPAWTSANVNDGRSAFFPLDLVKLFAAAHLSFAVKRRLVRPGCSRPPNKMTCSIDRNSQQLHSTAAKSKKDGAATRHVPAVGTPHKNRPGTIPGAV